MSHHGLVNGVRRRRRGGIRIALQAHPGRRNHKALRIELEMSIARRERLVGPWIPDDEKAVTLNVKIVGSPAGDVRARIGTLNKLILDGGGLDTSSDLNGWRAAGRARPHLHTAEGLAETVLKNNPAGLEAGRVGVGDVVADDVHFLLQVFHGADAGV